MSGKGEAEEQKPKVPVYIVTFSDMVTLLLTFFVMLLSLANVQDPELFDKGRDSFWQSISQKGLGILFGSRGVPYLGYSKTKYQSANSDEDYEGRSIDARDEQVRRTLRQVCEHMTVVPSQIAGRRTDFSVTEIHFGPGRWSLDASGRRFLVDFCRGIRRKDAGKIYVLGLCRDKLDEKERWLVSARRAKAVADYIEDVFNSRADGEGQYDGIVGMSGWPVYWWGAGDGGDWVVRKSPVYSELEILIAVIRGSV